MSPFVRMHCHKKALLWTLHSHAKADCVLNILLYGMHIALDSWHTQQSKASMLHSTAVSAAQATAAEVVETICVPDSEAHVASHQGEAADSKTKEDSANARQQWFASFGTAGNVHEVPHSQGG